MRKQANLRQGKQTQETTTTTKKNYSRTEGNRTT